MIGHARWRTASPRKGSRRLSRIYPRTLPRWGANRRPPTSDKGSARMQSVWDYATRLPAVNEKVVVMAFGWGVAPAVAFAEAQPMLAGTVIFFGPTPGQQDLAKI